MSDNYSLFKDGNGASVCFVQSSQKFGGHGVKNKDKKSAVNSFGAKAIRSEVKQQYDIVPLHEIHEYDFALISLTSVIEIENLLIDMKKKNPQKGRCTVIVGGMGCLNIWPLYDLIDVAVFGRAEGQINDIINGATPANVWRKSIDPCIEGKYEIRQSDRLLDGEAGIGCPNKCLFCQYTYIRNYLKKEGGIEYGYRAGNLGNTYNDDWNRIKLRPGKNQTAWDGLSDATRMRVHKPVTDKLICEKILNYIAEGNRKNTEIKTWQIVGYPWETPASVIKDLKGIGDMLAGIDGEPHEEGYHYSGSETGHILIDFLVTPFSPEPLTPMEAEDVSFYDWRKTLFNFEDRTGRKRRIHNGEKILCFILPQICGVHKLQRRIALNRCHKNNRHKVVDFVVNSKAAIDDFYAALDAHWIGQTDFLFVPNTN